MATHTPPQTGTIREGLVPYRLTARRFLAMIEAGIIPERPRVELIRGRLVERMTKNTPHDFAVDVIAEGLRPLVAPSHIVRQEKSLVLGRGSRPEPDVCVLRGPRETYRTRDPEAMDVALIVEVADSTYANAGLLGGEHRVAAGRGLHGAVRKRPIGRVFRDRSLRA